MGKNIKNIKITTNPGNVVVIRSGSGEATPNGFFLYHGVPKPIDKGNYNASGDIIKNGVYICTSGESNKKLFVGPQ
jgi:hypothetical protein